MSPFLAALHSGRVLLMDGGMGTELQRAGLLEGERENLEHPLKVRAIHQAYVDAGAQCVLTNTFQANPGALARRGVADQLDAIAQAGVRLARAAAWPSHWVLYDVGPAAEADSRLAVECALRAAESEKADGILVETASDLRNLTDLLAARATITSTIPVLMSWTFLRDAEGSIHTIHGLDPATCARQTMACEGVAALGVNCGRDIGSAEMTAIVRAFRGVTDLPLFARPNAGTPTRLGEQWVYPWTPELMAQHLPELLGSGVNMIGGCCGTTPAHIAALRPVVDTWNRRAAR